MQLPFFSSPRFRAALPLVRVLLSFYVTNGLAAALGLLLITGGIHLTLGEAAASAASVGVIVCIPPDQPAPKHHKFWMLVPAALIGLPLFVAVQVLHAHPVLLGLLLVPASFVAFLAGAWGKRGLPITMSIMFAVLFSMAVPDRADTSGLAASAWHFGLGAGLYLVYATVVNALLNARYRVQMLADTLFSLADLMRAQAQQFAPVTAVEADVATPLIGQLIRQQAALADQLQAARDLLLEAPRTPRRQRLAGILMGVLDMRDHLLACELDLDNFKSHPGHAPVLTALREVLDALADEVEHLADALLLGRTPTSFTTHRPRLAALHWTDESAVVDLDHPSPAMLARGLANRVGHLNDDTLRLCALARGEAEPDLDVVRASWQMFISPTGWSWRPLLALSHWKAPPLRHATRAALAMGVAYAIAVALPWGTHDYWILLTIVVVLRGSLAQTLERRNSRVAGTLLGCILAGGLMALHWPGWAMLCLLTLAQALSHAFAVRRYLVTAVAATVLGLLQAHLMSASISPAFEVVERIADTLIGVAVAWAFSYVLPSWERHQIPALVARTLAAQARHARVALGLGQLQAVDNEPELEWRLARREAYDSLSALVQATQRSLSEPRAVRPPLEPLGRLLAHSYQLLAQLTMVKTMLVLRRGRWRPERIKTPLADTAAAIYATLSSVPSRASDSTQPVADAPHAAPAPRMNVTPAVLPDPFEDDLSPWVLRRLELASRIATQLHDDAAHTLKASRR